MPWASHQDTVYVHHITLREWHPHLGHVDLDVYVKITIENLFSADDTPPRVIVTKPEARIIRHTEPMPADSQGDRYFIERGDFRRLLRNGRRAAKITWPYTNAREMRSKYVAHFTTQAQEHTAMYQSLAIEAYTDHLLESSARFDTAAAAIARFYSAQRQEELGVTIVT